MKKLILSGLFVGLALTAWAAQPTVTVSKLQTPLSVYVLNYSYSTAIASADSAFLVSEASSSTHIDISSYGFVDSLFSLELKSSEATADSVRHTVIVQVTTAASPADADWHTVFTDASSFTNAVKAHIPFRIRRLTMAHKMRIIVFENDTNKDATQTITARLAIRRLLK